MQPVALLLVFIGSGLGGVARYATGLAALRLWGPAFPYGTLTVNLIGGLLIGVLAGVWSSHDTSAFTRSFLVTGILGGFTTFSAFTLDSVTLIERHQTALATAYILASVCGAMLALTLGACLGRQLAS